MSGKKLFITIKWGALLGAGLSLIKLVSYYASTLDAGYPFGAISDLLMVAAFVGAIYMAIKEIRDKVQDGVIRFAPAFGHGIVVVVFAYLVMIAYLLCHYTFIETDGVEKNNQRNIQLAYERLEKDTITRSELIKYCEDVKTIIKAERTQMTIDSVCAAPLDSALDILLIAYERQLVDKPHASDDPAFQLDSFNVHANTLLYQCTEAILTNANETNKECLAQLPLLLENSGQTINGLNPLVTRFEAIKPTIPQSDSPVMAAFAYSLSILLYGLLLNIFVALFLYRNEKRKCSLEDEEPEEQPSETNQEETNNETK